MNSGKLKATINRGTTKEISWTIDDPVTPELVQSIKRAGDAMDLDWLASPFLNAIELLLTKYEIEELEEKLYDENPEIIEISALSLQNPLKENSTQDMKTLVRLYLPVMVILLNKMKEKY